MKRKYLYYIAAWTLTMSAVFGFAGTYLITRNPDQMYPIGVASFCIYFSVLGLGNWLINQRRRKDLFK